MSKKVLRQHRLNLAFLLTMSVFAPCGASLLAQSNAPLTEKDTIVLADFDNQSGETVFDGALEQALTIALGQSPFLNVLSDRKVSESLRAMGAVNAHIAGDVGRELCLRTRSKGVIAGTISNQWGRYLLEVTAFACTGAILA